MKPMWTLCIENLNKGEELPDKGYAVTEQTSADYDGKDLYIHLSNGSELKERKSLKQVISELPENLFLQPSSSYLVNCAFITAVKDKSIVLKDSSELPVVRERRREVMQSYLRYNTWR